MLTPKDNSDAKAQFDALNRSQAIIEFDPSGRGRSANDHFLTLPGYRHQRDIDKHATRGCRSCGDPVGLA